MRKIEKMMVNAINNGKEMNVQNTSVVKTRRGFIYVRLYNTIIFARVNGKDYFSDGGFSTVTTASRLRALGANYCIRQGEGILQGDNLLTQSEMQNLLFPF